MCVCVLNFGIFVCFEFFFGMAAFLHIDDRNCAHCKIVLTSIIL